MNCIFVVYVVICIILCHYNKPINQSLSQEDAQEEFGWKLVHGDVFRPPAKGMLLSTL